MNQNESCSKSRSARRGRWYNYRNRCKSPSILRTFDFLFFSVTIKKVLEANLFNEEYYRLP